jgi:hypothetical protein
LPLISPYRFMAQEGGLMAVPLRMRSTYAAARRNKSTGSTP